MTAELGQDHMKRRLIRSVYTETLEALETIIKGIEDWEIVSSAGCQPDEDGWVVVDKVDERWEDNDDGCKAWWEDAKIRERMGM